MDYLSRLFVQSATWIEVTSPTTSLTRETTTSHDIEGIRISVETIGRNSDSYGMGDASNATLYWLVGRSSSDGDTEVPAFKEGDMISTSNKVWTIVSISHCETLRGDRKHLEVRLS